MNVEMSGYITSLLDRFEVEFGSALRIVKTPFVAEGQWCTESDVSHPRFGKSACSYVASLLSLARMGRPDIMVAVVRLARWVTKWETCHDHALIRLFGYLKGTMGHVLRSTAIVNSVPDLVIWSDADLAGDCTDTRSTSGTWIELCFGDGSCWPITWGSKRQGASAYSTCESEVVALNVAIREEGLPLHALASEIIGHSLRIRCKEDNTQAIAAVQRGYSKNSGVCRGFIGCLLGLFTSYW